MKIDKLKFYERKYLAARTEKKKILFISYS